RPRADPGSRARAPAPGRSGSPVQVGDAAGERAMSAVLEAGLLELALELGRPRPGGDALPEIAVRSPVAGDEPADARQDPPEVEPVRGGPPAAPRRTELQHHESA